MAGLVGNIEEFREGIDWCQYIERLDLYFKANGIEAEEKRQATLLTVIGPAAYSLLRSLVSPAKPADKKYAELVQVMTEHYTPAPSEIVDRCKFNSRFRKDSETISKFIAALKSMAEHCNYGSTLGEMIRDRLVCGIRHDRIQRILLAEKKLDLAKAVDIATSVEMAERNVCDLQSTQAPRGNGATNRVFKQQAGHKKGKTGGQHRNSCYRCGQGHEMGKCKAVDATCHNCGKRGHFAKVCRSKTNSGQRKEVHTKFMAEISAEESTPPKDNNEEYFMHKASPKKEAPMLLELGISQNNTVMEIDTGATLSIVSEATYRAWKHQPQLSQSDVVLRTYTGDKIPVVGACNVNVRHNAQDLELPLLVVAGDGPNLLGRNWLARLKLDWNTIAVVKQTNSLDSVLANYNDLFHDGLGKLKGQTIQIAIQEDAQSKFSAPAIFQRTIEGLLADIPHTVAFLDDVLVTGATEKEHLENLDKVLNRLNDAGLRLKREKCVFFAPEVTYLGHRISQTGIHPTEEKVTAVKEAPTPTNVSELKSYLGILNYYGKFMPNLSTVLEALHVLLQKNTKCVWGAEQQRAFESSKTLLTSDKVLIHYDAKKPLVLNCDASPLWSGRGPCSQTGR
ncbi:uncharacterized protein [Diadema setosum]|uniref:uncharacterized protein n=1 Tax=Diadema setosum TaxID=31175 RepID=UPI003B3B0ADB